MKLHVKRGDVVTVIAGSHRGKEGKVLQVLKEKDRAIIEGVAMIKRHTRKSQDNPEGAIVEREGSIHLSNLKVLPQEEPKKTKKGGSKKAKAE